MPNFKVTRRVVQETTSVVEIEAPAKEIAEKELANNTSLDWKVSGQSNTVKVSIRKCADKKD
jgi:hypothetical protein